VVAGRDPREHAAAYGEAGDRTEAARIARLLAIEHEIGFGNTAAANG
jgi:hypothetical protein